MPPRPYSVAVDVKVTEQFTPVKRNYAARRSTTVKMTDAVSKGQAVFGKLPVDSMEIKTEREGKMYKRKSFCYILLDTLLLAVLIAALIEETD